MGENETILTNDELSIMEKEFINSISGEETNIDPKLFKGVFSLKTCEEIMELCPFISTVVNIYDTVNSIRGRKLIRDLAKFIYEFNTGNVQQKELQERITKLKENPKQLEKELEYILVIIDKSVGEEKPQNIAKLYMAYLCQKINWEEFTLFAEINERFLPGDLETLISSEVYETYKGNESDAILRLVGYGLVIETIQPIVDFDGGDATLNINDNSSEEDRIYRRTKLGNDMVFLLS